MAWGRFQNTGTGTTFKPWFKPSKDLDLPIWSDDMNIMNLDASPKLCSSFLVTSQSSNWGAELGLHPGFGQTCHQNKIFESAAVHGKYVFFLLFWDWESCMNFRKSVIQQHRVKYHLPFCVWGWKSAFEEKPWNSCVARDYRFHGIMECTRGEVWPVCMQF